MYLLHGLSSLLHCCECLAVDVCRLDGIYLLLESSNLPHRLLEGVLMALFALQRRLRRYRAHQSAQSASSPIWSPRVNKRTILVGVDILPCQGILLVYLGLQVPLTLLQHLQLRPQREDGILGVIFPPRGAAAKPAPHS